MIAWIKQELGTVDILVNNAGMNQRASMIDYTAEEFRHVLDVNLTAPFIVAKAVLPAMIEKRRGKIINLCSIMSEVGRETVSAYTAAKGGLKMLTKSMASEYGKYNIQCNGLGPGYIETAMTTVYQEPLPDGTPNPFDAFVRQRTPAGRWGTVEDMKGPAVFLASQASDYVNGHILYADGGLLSYVGGQG